MRRALGLLASFVVAPCLLCCAVPAFAALAPVWEADGQIISTGNGERTSISVVPDKTGGTYIVAATYKRLVHATSGPALS